MLRTLIVKEIRQHVTSARFAILSAIGFVFIAAAFAEGTFNHLDRIRDYTRAKAGTEERIRRIIDADGRINRDRNYWGEFTYRGYAVHRPPSPLSFLVPGMEPAMGRTVEIRGFGSQPARRAIRSWYAEEPMLSVFPGLDPAGVAQTVLGLVVLLLSYDAVCGEKQEGMLRVIASFSIPSYALLLAKFFGAFLPALAVFLVPTIAGLGITLLHPDIDLGAVAWNRIGFMGAAVAVYVGCLVCMGLFASTLTRRPSVSLALLLAAWTFNVLILPRLGPIAAGWVATPPSWAEQLIERKGLRRDASVQMAQRERDWQNTYRKQTGESYNATPDGRSQYYMNAEVVQSEIEPIFEAEEKRLGALYRVRYRYWLDIGIALARVSPTFAFHNALVHLSGTGLGPLRRFEDAVFDHVSQKRAWSNRKYTVDQMRRWNPSVYGAFDWKVDDLPRFVYEYSWAEEEVGEGMIDVLIVGLWGVLFFAAAAVGLSRYDPR